jgi:mandelate racemase
MTKSIAAGASGHVMLDVMKIGGVTGWLRAATPGAAYLEYLDHAGPLLAEPVEVKDGQILVSGRPGGGIEWDEAAVRRHGQDE